MSPSGATDTCRPPIITGAPCARTSSPAGEPQRVGELSLGRRQPAQHRQRAEHQPTRRQARPAVLRRPPHTRARATHGAVAGSCASTSTATVRWVAVRFAISEVPSWICAFVLPTAVGLPHETRSRGHWEVNEMPESEGSPRRAWLSDADTSSPPDTDPTPADDIFRPRRGSTDDAAAFSRPDSDEPQGETPIPAPVFPRSAGEVADSPSPAPRRSALSSSTPLEAETPAPPPRTQPARPGLAVWALGGLVGALVVGMIAFYASRGAEPAPPPHRAARPRRRPARAPPSSPHRRTSSPARIWPASRRPPRGR